MTIDNMICAQKSSDLGQVSINNRSVSVIEYAGKRVITLKMVDELHGRPEGTARRNFNSNKGRLVEGEDYFKVCADEIRTHKIVEISAKSREDVTLLTESGYLMLVKSFTDDLAWQVQKELVRSYFLRPQPKHEIPQTLHEALRLAADTEEKRIAAEAQVVALTPKAEALDELAAMDGCHNLRSAAQQCGWPEQKFIKKLQEIGWLYTHTVTGKKLAYGEKIKAGLMDVKNVQVKRSAGMQAVGQPMITQKGLAKLRTIIGPFSQTPA